MIVAFHSHGDAAADAVIATAASLTAAGLKPVTALISASAAQSLRLHALARALDLDVADADDLRGCAGSLETPLLLATCRLAPAHEGRQGMLQLTCAMDTGRRRGPVAGTKWRRVECGTALPVECPPVDPGASPGARALAFAAQVVAAHVLGPKLTHGRVSRLLCDGTGRHRASAVLSNLAYALDEAVDGPCDVGALARPADRRVVGGHRLRPAFDRQVSDVRSVLSA